MAQGSLLCLSEMTASVSAQFQLGPLCEDCLYEKWLVEIKDENYTGVEGQGVRNVHGFRGQKGATVSPNANKPLAPSPKRN